MKKSLITLFFLSSLIYANDINQELAELKSQTQKLIERINFLEQLQETKISKEIEVKVKEKFQNMPKSKGILELKNADTTLSIGGRVVIDIMQNSPSVGGGNSASDLSFVAGSIPINEDGENDQLNFSARDTRFWLKTRTPTDYGILQALVETDFAGSLGSERVVTPHQPRLRHAYININNFTIGQTFSTFMGVGNSDTLRSPVDVIHIRQPVLRWTKKLKKGNFHIALESPESTLTKSDGKRVAPDDDKLPDFIAKYVRKGRLGVGSISTIIRQIKNDKAVGDIKDNKIGSAVHIAGKIKTTGFDNFRFGFVYGNAVGRYAFWNAFNSANIDINGKISLNTMIGGHLAYQHWWSDKLRSNINYSSLESENNLNIVPSSVNKRLQSYHINLLWTPIENTQFGVEFIKALRELENGSEGELNRWFFNARYDF